MESPSTPRLGLAEIDESFLPQSTSGLQAKFARDSDRFSLGGA